MEKLAENIWAKVFPLAVLGAEIGRRVVVIRLQSGELIIHSTAAFSAADVAEIKALGRPGWIVEATLFHDTCAKGGRDAFGEIPYLVPEGFKAQGGLSLRNPPAEWSEEVEVIALEGMPKVGSIFFIIGRAGRSSRRICCSTSARNRRLGRGRFFAGPRAFANIPA
jgi:hypothetical protein